MANDVVIEVEARVGDAIAQMTLTAAAVRMLGDAGADAGSTIGDDSNRSSFSSRLRNLRNGLSNLGDRGPLGMVVRGFGNLASAMLSPIQMGADFAQNFEQVGSVGQVLIGTFASLTIGIGTLAAAFALAVVAVTALASVLGTLIAIAADFVAPLTLLVGLLASLGIGFGIAAKRASEGGGSLNKFSDELDKLKSMFGHTSTILAHVFLPYLMELGHAAEQALNFLDKIVKLPLGQAFRKIDTEGVPMLRKFVDRVAEVLSKPLKLAFRVAFEDTAFSDMVSDWWHRFTGFLFGHVESHPFLFPGRGIVLKSHQVDGILQPLIDWFNRHHFTRDGIKIGREIMRGVMSSGMRDRMSTFLVDVLKDAGKKGAIQYLVAVKWMTVQFIRLFTVVPRTLLRLMAPAWSGMKQAASSAWNSISSTIHGIWNRIVSFITAPIHINIDWPSIPGPIQSIIDKAGGLAGVFSAAGIPGGGGSPSIGTAGPRSRAMLMAAPNVVVMAGPLDSYSARRNTAAQIDHALQRRWARRR